MVRRKIGTALISHGERLMGLFSATDALLALAALVEDDRIPTEAEPELRETTVVPKGRFALEGEIGPQADARRARSVAPQPIAATSARSRGESRATRPVRFELRTGA
jgi:hypothetical protein